MYNFDYGIRICDFCSKSFQRDNEDWTKTVNNEIMCEKCNEKKKYESDWHHEKT